MKAQIKQLLDTVGVSTSPYHFVDEGIKQLQAAGFKELVLDENWKVKTGENYYINVYGTTLFAIRIPTGVNDLGIRMASAHTDWPCLRVKPNPEKKSDRYLSLNAEVYGGPIYATWMDRPLSVAGRVVLKGEDAFHPIAKLVDFKRPVLTIPNLAIHMNREVNQGVALNPQIDLQPLMGCFESGTEWSFADMLAQELKIKTEEILDYDLYIYVKEDGQLVGLQEDMIQAPRLDNLASCQACLRGICAAGDAQMSAICLFDNEECGSRSKQGADSNILAWILEKLYLSLGYSREEYLTGMLKSFMISADAAHALHPAHAEKGDPTNRIALDAGVVIKLESNQRYASDGRSAAVLEALMQDNGISYTRFVNRSDLRGGSTLGSILSSSLPISTVDIGVPMLAMHSAKELISVSSQEAIEQLLCIYFGKC